MEVAELHRERSDERNRLEGLYIQSIAEHFARQPRAEVQQVVEEVGRIDRFFASSSTRCVKPATAGAVTSVFFEYTYAAIAEGRGSTADAGRTGYSVIDSRPAERGNSTRMTSPS